MKKGDLSREQAIDQVGLDAVNNVERKNCAPTNRVGYNGEHQGDDLTEWRASVTCKDNAGNDATLEVYYYTTNADDKVIADCDGDGSSIDWDIQGYEIV